MTDHDKLLRISALFNGWANPGSKLIDPCTTLEAIGEVLGPPWSEAAPPPSPVPEPAGRPIQFALTMYGSDPYPTRVKVDTFLDGLRESVEPAGRWVPWSPERRAIRVGDRVRCDHREGTVTELHDRELLTIQIGPNSLIVRFSHSCGLQEPAPAPEQEPQPCDKE